MFDACERRAGVRVLDAGACLWVSAICTGTSFDTALKTTEVTPPQRLPVSG